MEVSEEVYFTTEKLTIYPKSLGVYLKSCYYLDEVWLTTKNCDRVMSKPHPSYKCIARASKIV